MTPFYFNLGHGYTPSQWELFYSSSNAGHMFRYTATGRAMAKLVARPPLADERRRDRGAGLRGGAVMSYRDPDAYYWHCLSIAATMPPGESRDWWFIRAGYVFQWGER